MDDGMPKFLYGTHYSTMAYTLHWLVRVVCYKYIIICSHTSLQEPYTNLHIDFNSGYFDDPNRIFFSMEETWNNCLESTSDVRVRRNKVIFSYFFNYLKFLLRTSKVTNLL